MNTAAFFDIDGTLFRDSLMIEHFKKLLKYEVLDEALWHNSVKQTYGNWKKRRGNYDDYLLELADIYIDSLKGMKKSKMDFITDQVIELKGDTVYMYTRHQIAWHKEMGHLVIFISGSPYDLVRKMGEKYGITDSIGTKYLIDEDDRFTGEVEKMWDADSKHSAVISFRDRYDIDLASSYAYGDTNGDLSMFALVGNPITINPTRDLLTHLKENDALRDKIKVVVERKDVIYMLDASVPITIPDTDDG